MLAIAFSLLLVISFSKFSVSAETLGEKETKTMSEPKVNEKNIEDTISPKEKKSEKTEIAEKSDKSDKSEKAGNQVKEAKKNQIKNLR